MTNPVSDAFSSNYRDARGKFVRAADKAQLPVSSQIHPLRGKDDEELALDVVRDGPSDASRVLLISSACHGVEGYCGSGIQVDLLSDPKWRAAAADAGVAVVYAHALNPWGFSWLRRTTHENVDINRNVHDFTQALPANAGYEALADSIVPTQWHFSQADTLRGW